MSEQALIGLAAVIVLGIAAQWLAWRLKLPSILFLLLFGFAAGQIMIGGDHPHLLLNPDLLFGDLLSPLVAICVALILFEGGLSLRLSELKQIGATVISLVTFGVALTWVMTVAAAHWILGLNLRLALLLGAMLVVTGPTVIGPLLQMIRPTGKVASIAKWEGITIDPIGVLLAVIVFEVILAGELQDATPEVLRVLLMTFVSGIGLGISAAWLLIVVMRRYWIPDYLQEAVTLMIVVGAFLLSEMVQEESGLFTATLMGIILANQKQVEVSHIVTFKETLRTLIISSLFIILAARLDLEHFQALDWRAVAFLVCLVLVVRPFAVILSTSEAALTWKEKAFLSWLAPRGIVAAAVSSVFALRLQQTNIPQTEMLVPVTFAVIVATVALYGLTAPLLARRLGLSQENPQGVIFMGAHSWARAFATVLKGAGYRTLLVDTNRANTYRARMDGLEVIHGSVVRDHLEDQVNLNGIGKLIALTPNDEANSLAAIHFMHLFGREQVYQVAPWKPAKGKESEAPRNLRGRFLFGEDANYSYLMDRMSRGSVVKRSKLSGEYDYDAFLERYGDQAVLLFVIDENDKLLVNTRKDPLKPKSGQTIIALVDEVEGLPAETVTQS